jgi:3-hydroxymyristoyl/3-hydroxydecanoyl-(acyl carrier protein) dehydratase
MQKSNPSTGPMPPLPPGTVVQPMPRPPAVAAASPSQAESPRVHPLAAQHERVAAAHQRFLELQKQVHGDFLAHRRELLSRLQDVWISAPVDEERQGPVESDALGTTLETEVTWEDEFLDGHVMPASMLLELSGRLLAASRGPAAAASVVVLECDLEHLGPLPEPGETVAAEARGSRAPHIEVQSHLQIAFRAHRRPPQPDAPSATPGDARALARMEVRQWADGEGSPEGSTWSEPRTSDGGAPAARATWPAWTRKVRFSERDLDALGRGEVFSCFGEGFERSASHTRTPPLPGSRLVRLASVETIEKEGGSFAMGYLRARAAAEPSMAFDGDRGLCFARLYQGALQTLAFFVTAAGATVARDGWRFEPLQNHVANLRWFDSPALDAAPLEYELVVERFDGAPFATIVGDVRAWADGKLVFDARRLSLTLVPDWPLTSDLALLADGAAEDARPMPVAEIQGFRIGYRSLLAGALGRPSDAFREAGSFFETGLRRMPRLPGPPYHFITRVTAIEGEGLTMRPGAEATFEYDVPQDAWYFDENGNRTMPFCVLLEAALQPCGWLSVYVGCPVTTNVDVLFRNLDGASMTMTGEIFPDSRTLRTRAKVTSVTRVSGVMLLSYKIECFVGDRCVCHLNATFGYFPEEVLALQVGLPTTDEQKAQLTAESTLRVDFAQRPERYFAGPLRLPGPILLMMDRVTGSFPASGASGKVRLRAEKDVDPSAWFFKAHFYSDPVQPGSLGLEMMLQLLQFFIIHEDLAKAIEDPYFEPLALDSPVSWKFRGQVRPENKHIVTDLEITSVESGADGLTVIADGSLWVDGMRCYEAKGIAMRARSGRRARPVPPKTAEAVLDPSIDRWVTDHRPSCTVPVMPGMGMVDRLAAAALAHVRAAYPTGEGAHEWAVVAVDDVRHHGGWLTCDAPKLLRTEVTLLGARAVHRVDEVQASVDLSDIDTSGNARRVSTGRVRLARRFDVPPRAWAPLADAVAASSPYESGPIYWGPRLQLLRRLSVGSHGASAELDAAGADAPIGAVHPILLDGALHAIAHDELERWSSNIRPGQMGVPVRLTARFFGPPPDRGTVRAEVRFSGFDGANAFPVFLIQMIDPQGRVWATLRHVELLIPFARQSRLKREQYRPFLLERRFCAGAGLSEFHDDRTELHVADVKRMDALPGSVAYTYELETGAPVDVRVVAIKDHVAQRARAHPSRVLVDPTYREGHIAELPSVVFPVTVEEREGVVIVRDAPAPRTHGQA